MPAPYGLDLHQKAIAAIEAGHSKAAVSRLMGIGTTTLTEWHNRYRANGELAAKQGYQQGHSQKITDWEEFRAFAAQHGDKTQAEMAQLWPAEISEDTIGRGLQRIGLTRKKKTYLYAERDTQKRQAYERELAQFEESQRVYLDEAGIDNTADYAYGWCPKGERAAERRGTRTERVSFLAAWQQQQLIAPLTYQGYCNRLVFETWLEEKLLLVLPPGSVVICDNASFHKGGRIETLIQQAGCHLLYLLSYSPDLNPIEHQWFVLKNRMRKQIQSGKPFRQVVDQAFID